MLDSRSQKRSLPTTLPTLELPSASAVWQGLQIFPCREVRYRSGSTDDKTATVVVLVGPGEPASHVALPSVLFLRPTSAFTLVFESKKSPLMMSENTEGNLAFVNHFAKPKLPLQLYYFIGTVLHCVDS